MDNKLSCIEFSPDGTKEVTEFLTLHTTGGKTYPVGITVPYGYGSISYISSQIGGLNVEDERTCKQEWTFEWDQAAFEFQQALFQQLLSSGSTFEPVNIPHKVNVTVYDQFMEGEKYTLVHLLNATGSNMKKGEIVPGGVPDQPFPEMSEDIVFKIELPGLKNAYIVSPDFPGHKLVKTLQLVNGWYEVTIPKRLLKCYSIVWLESGKE